MRHLHIHEISFCSCIVIILNRQYKIITSLENAGRIDRTIFEYRKLVLGLIARIVVAWGGGDEFFASAIERLEKSIEDSERDLEIIEKLFCFPTSFSASKAPDFERFAYMCPQYYLRQAIVAALGAIQARAKHFVRPHYEGDAIPLTIIEFLKADRPWLTLYGNDRGLCFNMNDYDNLPCRNYWSDRAEVVRKTNNGCVFKVKMFDSATDSWMWCDWYADEMRDDARITSILASIDIPDAILLPDEMIVWHHFHVSSELRVFSTKAPETAAEPEFAPFEGLVLPEAFVEYALSPARVS